MHLSLKGIGISTSLLGWERIPKLPCYDHWQGSVLEKGGNCGIYGCCGKLGAKEGKASPQGHTKRCFSAPVGQSQPIPPALSAPKSSKELREQTSSSPQHKASLLCISRGCNGFHSWRSELNDKVNWHPLEEEHEPSNKVLAQDPFARVAGRGQNCSAAAG